LYLECDTKKFDDATIARSEKTDYPISRALTTRSQRDKIESEVDGVLEILDAGEQTDRQSRIRLRVAPGTPLEKLCACPNTIQRQTTEKVYIY